MNTQRLKLVIHGGVVEILPLSHQAEQAYHDALHQALHIGYQQLISGESSLNAVQTTIEFLENSPLFNAGYGSVLTQAGTVELDAAIMDGNTLQAGAVAALTRIANPIHLAKMVLEQSEHVMLIGPQAEQFAKHCGLSWVEPATLISKTQKAKWLDRQNHANCLQDKYGTVGAVAIDQHGNLAAGTSTGGLAHKHPGRVSDSCIIGAGTYANNNTCAVSTTGHGEYFMRLLIAYDVAALIAYRHQSVTSAVRAALKKISALGGQGGIIALDRFGHMAMQFNTKGMYRGYVENGHYITKIS